VGGVGQSADSCAGTGDCRTGIGGAQRIAVAGEATDLVRARLGCDFAVGSFDGWLGEAEGVGNFVSCGRIGSVAVHPCRDSSTARMGRPHFKQNERELPADAKRDWDQFGGSSAVGGIDGGCVDEEVAGFGENLRLPVAVGAAQPVGKTNAKIAAPLVG